jgi:hypothetical protein
MQIPVGHAFGAPESSKLDGLPCSIGGLIEDNPKESRKL